ncbi:MAG: hypothetical protein N2316_08635 [Spirochaetes bacterium]|nr:hypothetical protein [Spirochaetota bacterium]
MVIVSFTQIDWIIIRQALSISLATGKHCCIKDAMAFLALHPHFGAFLSDVEEFLHKYGWGTFETQKNDLLFYPQSPTFGTFQISINPYSSAIEMMLFIMPALFSQDFRSKIFLSGVTHSPHSYGTTWMKESFLTFLEQMGFYASCTLRRFGFYASGGGFIEAKVYPHEKHTFSFQSFNNKTITLQGARIYIAHLDNSIATQEKALLCDLLHIDDNQVKVLEIRDCDGAANHIEIYFDLNAFPIVLSESIPVYDYSGNFVFSDEKIIATIQTLTQKATEIAHQSQLPLEIERELSLYELFTSTNYFGISEMSLLTRALVESFS